MKKLHPLVVSCTFPTYVAPSVTAVHALSWSAWVLFEHNSPQLVTPLPRAAEHASFISIWKMGSLSHAHAHMQKFNDVGQVQLMAINKQATLGQRGFLVVDRQR
jgi:hypothetical protein